MNNSNADSVYQELLTKSLNTIRKQISSLESKNKGLRAITDKTTIEIDGLKIQYGQIVQQLEKFEGRKELSERKENILEKWDAKSAYIEQKETNLKQSIQELTNLQNNLQTKRARKKISKKMEHKLQLLKLLQKTSNVIDTRQKIVLLPKYLKDKKRANLLATQQARVNLTAAKIEDNNQLQAMLNKDGNILDKLQLKIYDIKGKYYQKKLSHSIDVFHTMRQSKSNIAIRGANAITLSKKAVDKFRKKQEMLKTATPTESQTNLVPVAAIR